MKNPKWHRDEIILALDFYFDNDRGSIDSRNPKVIDLSQTLNTLPLFEIKPDTKFRNPNGVSLKLSNFLALDPNYAGKGMISYSKLDKEVFEEFYYDRKRLKEIANEIKKIASNPELRSKIFLIENDELSDSDGVKEGQIIYKLHKIRERDRSIIQKKKNLTLKKTGKLICEACDFDFENVYGKLGKGFIECHHLIPLSEYKSEKNTNFEDLALLCSNCHRMIHRDTNISNISDFKKKLNKKYCS